MQVRVHSVVYTADNVLTPAVIKTIYRQRKLLNQLTINNKTFDDFCIKVSHLTIRARNEPSEKLSHSRGRPLLGRAFS